jgi:hypothetical protein
MSELVKALIAARKEMGAAKKGKDNPFFKSKYADLASVMEAVKGPLEAHGLSFLQDIENGAVITVILHESGETMRLAPFPVMSTKQDAQGVGSGVTYARRYSLQTALGVPAEDDDGNAASQPQKKFPSPVASAIEGVQVDKAKVAKVAATLVDLHAANEAGEDVGYSAFETVETLDSDEKLAVWSELAQYSKVRSWLKKVSAEHRATA